MLRTEYFLNYNGILSRFINNNVEAYIEPQRSGVPKGSIIGFSRAKNAATYYFLCNFSAKEISERLNINYSVLRNWRTENPFKNQIKRNTEDFTLFFFSNVEGFLSEYNTKTHTNKNVQDAVERIMIRYFDDIDLYGREVLANICISTPNNLTKILDRNKIFLIKFYYYFVYDLLNHSSIGKKYKNNLIRKFKANYIKSLSLGIVDKKENKSSKLSALELAAKNRIEIAVKKRKEDSDNQDLAMEILKIIADIA
jgi:hypothetical protein